MSRPETYEKKRSGKKFFSFMRAIILILIFSTIGIVAYFYRDMITTDNIKRLFAIFEMDSGQASSVNADIYYDSSPKGQFKAYRGYLVMANENGLYLFDRSGNEKQHTRLDTSSPYIEVCDKYILSYERGGTTLIALNSIATVFTKKYENPLLLARASNGGFIAAAVDEPRYSAVITVYNGQFNEIFKNWIPEDRPLLDMAISPDNSTMAVITLQNNNGDLCSYLEVFNFTSETPVMTYKFDGSLVLSASYLNKDCISLIADDKTIMIDILKSTASEYSYGRDTLQTYSQQMENGAVIVLNRRSLTTDCLLLLLDNQCKVISQLELKEEIKSLATLGNMILILGQNKAKIYDTKGKIVKEYEAGKDAICSLLLDKNNMAVINKSWAIINPVN